MDALKIQQLSLPTLEIFLEIEEEILINAAKKLRKDKTLLNGDIRTWQANKLSELGALTDENIEILAKHSSLALDEVRQLVEEAGYTAVENVEQDLKEGAKRGILKPAKAIEDSSALINVLRAYEDDAKDWINLVNTTMLNQSGRQYLDVVNTTTAKVLTGTITPEKALRQAAAKWADEGVPALIDKGGARWSTEGYINMVTRSTAANVANSMQDARMDEYDADLIEISSHAGARPLCEPYQGRIFSRTGRTKGYPSLGSTSYGEAAGLFGINCGHYRYPYIAGITKQRYEPYDKAENDAVYKESQKQRYLERQIRKGKREVNMMEAMNDKEGLEQAKQKVLSRQASMREFIKDSGRTRRSDREQLAVNNPHVRGTAKG